MLLSLCKQYGGQLHSIGDQDSVLLPYHSAVLACLPGLNVALLLVEFTIGKGELEICSMGQLHGTLVTSYWPEFSHMVILYCKGNWEM